MSTLVSWCGKRLCAEGVTMDLPYEIAGAWPKDDGVVVLFDPQTPWSAVDPEHLAPIRGGPSGPAAFRNVALYELNATARWWAEFHPRYGTEYYATVTSISPLRMRTHSEFEIQLSAVNGSVERERDLRSRAFDWWYPREWLRRAARLHDWQSVWYKDNLVFREDSTVEVPGRAWQAFESGDVLVVLVVIEEKRWSPLYPNIYAFGSSNELLWIGEMDEALISDPASYRGEMSDTIQCLDPLIVLSASSHLCLIDIDTGRVVDAMLTK